MTENDSTKKVRTELELDVSSFVKSTNTATDKAEQLADEIDELKQRLKKLGVESEDSGKKVESSLNKIIPRFLGFAAVARVMKSAWTNTVQMESSLTSLNVTLDKSAQKVENFADKYTKMSGMSKMAILDMSNSLTLLLANIVDSQDTIAGLSNEMIVQIDRVSSATGRSADEISRRYQQLIRGNLGAFRDLGIDTRKEYLELTDTFKKYAGDRAWNDLSRNEQTQIAIIETMIQVDNRFTKTVDTTESKMNRLQSRWENLTTSIGSFLSIATPLLDFFSSILETATDGFDGLQMLGDGMQYVVIGGVAFVAFAPSILSGLKAFAVGSLSASTGFMMLGASILWFALIAGQAFKKSQEKNTEIIEEQTESIEEQIEATEELNNARGGLMGIDEINTLSGTSGSLLDDEDDLTKSSEWIDSYLEGLDSLQDSMSDTISKTEDEIKSMQTLMSTIMGVVGAYSAMQLIIKSVIAIKKIKTAATIKDTLAEKQAEAAQLAKNQAEAQGVGTSNASAAADTREAAAAQADATAQLGAAAGHAAKNTAASWGTWAAIGLPLIAGIIGGVVGYASTVKMARGGVVNQETTATIGEGVYHEAVVPLGNSPEWNDTKEDLAEYLVENGGNKETSITTIVEIDGREIVKAISDDMYDDWKRRGRV